MGTGHKHNAYQAKYSLHKIKMNLFKKKVNGIVYYIMADANSKHLSLAILIYEIKTHSRFSELLEE